MIHTNKYSDFITVQPDQYEGGYTPSIPADFTITNKDHTPDEWARIVEDITIRLMDPSLTSRQRSHLQIQKKWAKLFLKATTDPDERSGYLKRHRKIMSGQAASRQYYKGRTAEEKKRLTEEIKHASEQIEELKRRKKEMVIRRSKLVSDGVWRDIEALPDDVSVEGNEFLFSDLPRAIRKPRKKGTSGTEIRRPSGTTSAASGT